LTSSNRAEISRIEAVVAIITHHKIVVGRNTHWPECAHRWNSVYGHNRVRVEGKLFGGEYAMGALRVGKLLGYCGL